MSPLKFGIGVRPEASVDRFYTKIGVETATPLGVSTPDTHGDGSVESL